MEEKRQMLKEKTKNRLSFLGLYFIGIAWGLGYIGVQLAVDNGWSSLAIMVSKGLIGGGICLAFSFKEKWWKDKSLIKGAVICGVFTFLGYLFQTEGQKLTTVSSCAFFTATNVVYVPIIAFIFFKKKITPRFLIATFVALLGTGILNYDGTSFQFGLGEVYNLLGAICFAIQIAYMGTLAQHNKPFSCAGLQLMVMGIIAICVVPFVKVNHFGNGNIQGWIGIIYVTLISSALCYIIQAFSEKYVNETIAGILLSQESVFGTLFSVLILNETLTIYRIIGGAIVVLSVLLCSIDVKKIYLKIKNKKSKENTFVLEKNDINTQNNEVD